VAVIDGSTSLLDAARIIADAGLRVRSASYDGVRWHVRLASDDCDWTETAPTLWLALERARSTHVRRGGVQ
jgi:hypothetical protein